MLTIDPDARVTARLTDATAVWLTTVDPSGTPQPTPVWFLWTGTDVLIFSQPGKAKLRNLAANPRVSLNLDGNGRGGDIVVLTGTAAVDAGPTEQELAAYDEKYAADITRIGMTPETFHASYAVPIRFRPEKLR
jgi:PPOX class probable F420-dependent enzyme